MGIKDARVQKVAILDRVVRENFERVPFRERPERSKRVNGADTHRKS